MKNIKFLILASLVFAFAGCKNVETPNGRIPAEYLDLAKAYTGIFKGSFNGQNGDLHVYIVGDIARVKFIDGGRNDIIGERCESKIKLLKSVKFSGTKRTPKLDEAIFDFDPGNCKGQIQGRTLNIYYSVNRDGILTINANILEKIDQVYKCVPGYPTSNNCHYDTITQFVSGKFVKIR